MTNEVDPRSLPLDELRRLRNSLQHEDDVVSYVRRIAQTRVDLVSSERARRCGEQRSDDVQSELRNVLAHHLTAATARPPRPNIELEDHPLSDELDAISADYGFSRLDSLDMAQLDALESQLVEFERRVSSDRKQRFDRIDALSAELVCRYRDGEASVDGLRET